MSAVSSLTSLDQISDFLIGQKNDLSDQSFDADHRVDQTNERVQKIVFGDETVTIESVMTMKKVHVPEGAVFCGGRRWKDIAALTVTPPNAEVIQAITDHFKSQTVTPLWSPPMPAFNKVTINGEKIAI